MGACFARASAKVAVADATAERAIAAGVPTSAVTAESAAAANAAPPSTLAEAVRIGDAHAVASFIEQGTDPAAEPGLLHSAAENGSGEIVALLLAAGASPSDVDDDGQTPLHIAVVNGSTDAVEKLTATQPCDELRITDKYRMNPLHLACEEGDPTMIALLLARGASQTPGTPTRPTRRWDAAGEERHEDPADEPPALSAPNSSGGDATSAPLEAPPLSPTSPMSARRKQLLQMQQKHGGSAVFIAQRHEHHEAVALLQRAANGEPIPMPDLTQSDKR